MNPPARLRLVSADPQPPRRGPRADVAGELQRGRPAGQAEVEGHRRQRVARQQQHQRVGLAAVGQPQPAADPPQPGRLARPPSRPWPGRAAGPGGRASRRGAGRSAAPRPRRAQRSGGGRSGGTALVRTSCATLSRSPYVASTRTRSTSAPSAPRLGQRHLPGGDGAAAAEHLGAHVAGPGRRRGQVVGADRERVGGGRRRGPARRESARPASAMSRPPLTALPISHPSPSSAPQAPASSSGASARAWSSSLDRVAARRRRGAGLERPRRPPGDGVSARQRGHSLAVRRCGRPPARACAALSVALSRCAACRSSSARSSACSSASPSPSCSRGMVIAAAAPRPCPPSATCCASAWSTSRRRVERGRPDRLRARPAARRPRPGRAAGRRRWSATGREQFSQLGERLSHVTSTTDALRAQTASLAGVAQRLDRPRHLGRGAAAPGARARRACWPAATSTSRSRRVSRTSAASGPTSSCGCPATSASSSTPRPR